MGVGVVTEMVIRSAGLKLSGPRKMPFCSSPSASEVKITEYLFQDIRHIRERLLRLSFKGGADEEQGDSISEEHEVKRCTYGMELSECFPLWRFRERLKGVDLLLNPKDLGIELERHKYIDSNSYDG